MTLTSPLFRQDAPSPFTADEETPPPAPERRNGCDPDPPHTGCRSVSRPFADIDDHFVSLIAAHSSRLLAVARRYLDDDGARDAVQDTFVKAWHNGRRFEGRAELTTWLHRITVNACLDRLRRQASRRETPLDSLPGDTLERCLGGARADEEPERCLERNELVGLCREGILQMPPAYRMILVLRDIEGLSGVETAEALGISVNLVKVRLHRARRALRDLIGPRMPP